MAKIATTGAVAPETPQAAPINKEAVIAIQGGGLYALPMLGQVRVVLAAGYVPLGFAGNSGGAILATLLWAGLTPDRIQKAFADTLENDPDGLTKLLLPKNATKKNLMLRGLYDLRDRAAKLLPFPTGLIGRLSYPARKFATFLQIAGPFRDAWNRRALFAGGGLSNFLETLIKEGLGRGDRASPITVADAMETKTGRPGRHNRTSSRDLEP